MKLKPSHIIVNNFGIVKLTNMNIFNKIDDSYFLHYDNIKYLAFFLLKLKIFLVRNF